MSTQETESSWKLACCQSDPSLLHVKPPGAQASNTDLKWRHNLFQPFLLLHSSPAPGDAERRWLNLRVDSAQANQGEYEKAKMEWGESRVW